MSLTGEASHSKHGADIGEEFTQMMWGESLEMAQLSKRERPHWQGFFEEAVSNVSKFSTTWMAKGVDVDNQTYNWATKQIYYLKKYNNERAQSLPVPPL